MYLVNSNTDGAYTIDRATAQVTLLGPTGLSNPNALAFDPQQNALYVLDNSLDLLGILNRSTGAVTTIGVATSTNLLGLVCVP